MPTYGERTCACCGLPFIAQAINTRYCSYICNRRAAGRRWRQKPASDNWRPEITRSPIPTAQPQSSEAAPIAVPEPPPSTPEEEELRKKQEELHRLFPPITGDEALKSTGYTTQRPATPTEEKKHEEGKED